MAYLGNMFTHPRSEDFLIWTLLREGLDCGIRDNALRHLRSHFLAILEEQVHVIHESPERLPLHLVL